MNNYEQTKLANGSLYDLVPGGITETGEKLTIIALLGDRSLTEIDSSQVDEDGNPIMEYQDITGTVVVIELVKSDLRKEVQNLSETFDMLVLSNLEG